MSRTPVVGSVDVKVRVASHLSKVPVTATDAFTANLIELSSVVILKTGTCARLTDGNTADAKRIRIANRMLVRVCLSNINFLPTGHQSGHPNAMRTEAPRKTGKTASLQVESLEPLDPFRITDEHSWRWAWMVYETR